MTDEESPLADLKSREQVKEKTPLPLDSKTAEIDLSEEPTLVLSAETMALQLQDQDSKQDSAQANAQNEDNPASKNISLPSREEVRQHWYRFQDQARHTWVQCSALANRIGGRGRESFDHVWVTLAPWLGQTHRWIRKTGFETQKRLAPVARRAAERGKPFIARAWRGTGRAMRRARHQYPIVGLLASILAVYIGLHLVAYSESIELLEGTPYYAGCGLGLLAWGLFFWWGSNFHAEDFHVGGDVGICMVPFLVAFPLLFTGFLTVVNVWFDGSPEKEHITTLVEPLGRLQTGNPKEDLKGVVGLQSWRPSEEQLFLEVPAQDFRLLTLGSPVKVRTRQGALGMEYLVWIQPVSAGP